MMLPCGAHLLYDCCLASLEYERRAIRSYYNYEYLRRLRNSL
jgi:hypothetical protein